MITPYYNDKNNFVLYRGDVNQVLADIKEKVDVIFADPPYFLSSQKQIIQNGRIKICNKGDWDRVASLESINTFNRNWLLRCRNILKDNGTIWVCGTYHNIYSVEQCLIELGFQILNIVVWQKSDPPPTPYGGRFNFSAEYIVWARKNPKAIHCFHYDELKQMNGGKEMPDVWKIPSTGAWERKCGKHPTQKPLRLLYRVIQSCTEKGYVVLDPFAGSCTTGIAANLLYRKFIGIDQSQEFLDYGIRRKHEIEDATRAEWMLKKISENPEEVMVMVNHARPDLYRRMIETGICYLRAGDSKGSLLVTPGFERLNYVLLHSNGENAQLFKLKTRGHFQIWTRETLQQYGFNPQNAAYYVVLHFDSTKRIDIKHCPNLKEHKYTYKAKICPLSDFVGI